MKNILRNIFFLSTLFFLPRAVFSQQKAAYQVPDSYTFDYEVVQQATGSNKSSGKPQTITYHYTQNGDYTGMSVASDKNNNLIIFAKDGTMIIVDDQKKTITIVRLQGLISDLAKIAAQYDKNNPSATSAKHDSTDFKFAKTGSTKQVSGYTAEEYGYTDSKGEKGSVWYAKVDFNTSLFFMFGAGASPMGGGMKRSAQAPPSYPQFYDPHLLVTELDNKSKPGEALVTQSISKKSLVINTKGYTINNLSNMMGR